MEQNGAITGAKTKKAPPKVRFVGQERKRGEKGCEKDANVCQNDANMELNSMPKVINNLWKNR